MKPYIKYLLDTIRGEGERDFVKKNEKSDDRLARSMVADNASNPSIGPNGKNPFAGPGVEPLEGAKTLRGSHLPGEDADVYEDVSSEIKEKLQKNKEKKAFTVHLKHKETGKFNTTTMKANSPEQAMDRAEEKFPNHHVEKAVRQLHKEEKILITDVLDEAMRLSDEEKQKRNDIVNSMLKNKVDFKHRYGKNWKNVMFATATRMVTGEEVDWSNVENCDLSIEIITENYLSEHIGHIKKGALHKMEGIPAGKKIGAKKLYALKAHGTPLERKRAIFALNMNHEDVNEETWGIPSDFSEFGDGAKELIFHAENTPHLVDHKHPYIAAMVNRMRKGNYDHDKGKELWGAYANHVASDYAHEHNTHKSMFSKEDKHQVAAHFEKKHSKNIEDNMKAGIHEEIENIDYSELIDDLRIAVIDDQSLTLEFADGSEKEINPSKANQFLNIFDSLDEDDQSDLILIVSSNPKALKKVLKEHNKDEMFCKNCSKSLEKHYSMGDLLSHIDKCKIPREDANVAIRHQSQKDVDAAINRTTGIGVPNRV
jgi:hypothetical protein